MLRSGLVLGSSPLSLDIDIPATRVFGNVTVNGKAISEIGNPYFSLSLKASAGQATLVQFPTQSAYSTLVVPGTYDLYYSNPLAAGLEIPANFGTKLQSAIVVGPTPLSLDVDIRGTLLAGNLSVNGVTLTDSGHLGSSLGLYDADGIDVVLRPREHPVPTQPDSC